MDFQSIPTFVEMERRHFIRTIGLALVMDSLSAADPDQAGTVRYFSPATSCIIRITWVLYPASLSYQT